MITELQMPKDYIAVDGGCANTATGGVGYYRGILIRNGETSKGKILFEYGFPESTNNLTEYVAILDAMKWRIDHKQEDIPIYSDSSVALSWIRKGKNNCDKLPMWKEAFAYTKKMEKWRDDNKVPFENIYKWHTKKRGEIPADFGKKLGGLNLYPKKQYMDKLSLSEKIKKGMDEQEFSLEVISRAIYGDFYGDEILNEIDQLTDERKPNMTQLHFGALIYSGVDPATAFQCVFIKRSNEVEELKLQYVKAEANKKPILKLKLEKMMKNIEMDAIQYRGSRGVEQAMLYCTRSKQDQRYPQLREDKELCLKFLYNIMYKTHLEIEAGHNIPYNGSVLRAVAHEVTLLDRQMPANINIFNIGDALKQVDTLNKDELVTVIDDNLKLN